MDIVQVSLSELHWEQFISCCIVYFAKLRVYRPPLVVFSKSAEERSRGDCKILIWGWGWWGYLKRDECFWEGLVFFIDFFITFLPRKLSLAHLVYVVSEWSFKYESMAWYQSWPAFLNLFLRKYNNIILYNLLLCTYMFFMLLKQLHIKNVSLPEREGCSKKKGF